MPAEHFSTQAGKQKTAKFLPCVKNEEERGPAMSIWDQPAQGKIDTVLVRRRTEAEIRADFEGLFKLQIRGSLGQWA